MNVLFICQGNVARSQEAAAYLHVMRPDLRITSAGTEAEVGKPLDPLVLQVTTEDGLDLRESHRKQLDSDLLSGADYIISFVKDQKLRNYTINEYWDVADPRGGTLEVHRATRDDIKHRVTTLAAALV